MNLQLLPALRTEYKVAASPAIPFIKGRYSVLHTEYLLPYIIKTLHVDEPGPLYGVEGQK